MNDTFFNERIPSQAKEILRLLIGAEINQITRCVWGDKDEFNETKAYYELRDDEVFQFISGSLVISLKSGFEIAFSSQDELSSITVWLEKNQTNQKNEDYYIDDDELYLIKNDNVKYTNDRIKSLKNRKIESLKILKRKPKNINYLDLPNEVGVQLDFDNGESLIMSHYLAFEKAADSFHIIFKDEISKEILLDLEEIEI